MVELTEFVQRRCWELIHIFDEKASGIRDNRPQLIELMKEARQRRFDVIIVYKLDRLARSMKHLVTLLHEFHELDIEFVSLKDSLDLASASGRLLTHLLGAFAEFEADLIRSRVNAGLANARRKGKRLGRPPTLDHSKILNLRETGLSLSAIAMRLGCTKGAVSKSLKKTRLQVVEKRGSCDKKKGVSKTKVLETGLEPPN